MQILLCRLSRPRGHPPVTQRISQSINEIPFSLINLSRLTFFLKSIFASYVFLLLFFIDGADDTFLGLVAMASLTFTSTRLGDLCVGLE